MSRRPDYNGPIAKSLSAEKQSCQRKRAILENCIPSCEGM